MSSHYDAAKPLIEAAMPPEASGRPAGWRLSSQTLRSGWRSGLALLVGGLIVALSWSRLAFGDASLLVFHDNSEQSYAWWRYNVAELQSGRLPLWNPYTAGGRSNIGEGQEGGLYPLFVLVAILGGPLASTVSAIQAFAFVHALIGFAGGYWLARAQRLGSLAALAGGLAFALGGFFSTRALGQLNIFHATAWTPFVLAGALLIARTKRLEWGLLSGAALALSILAGHAQPAYHTLLALGLCLTALCCFSLVPGQPPLGWRRTVAALLIILGSGFGLAAVQLLPMVEYQARAFRWVGGDGPIVANARIPFSIIAQNPSLELRALPSVLFAHAGDIRDGNLFFGVIGMVAAVLGMVASPYRLRWVWTVLAGFGLILAFGASTPMLALVYQVIPFSDKVREPVRYLMLAHLGLSMLIALGVERMATEPLRGAKVRAALGVATLATGLTLLAVFRLTPLPKSVIDGLAIGLAAAVVLIVILLLAATRPTLTAAGLVGLLAIELGLTWSGTLPRQSGYDAAGNREVRQHYFGPVAAGVRAFLAAQPGWYRADYIDAPVPRNFGAIIRVPSTSGYGATRPLRVHRLQERLGFLAPGRGADLLGIRYFFAGQDLPKLPKVHQIGPVRVYENSQALPFAWLAGTARVVADDEAALATLSAPDFDPRTMVVLTESAPPALPPLQPGPQAAVEVLAYTPDLVRLHVRSEGTTVLVTSDPDYPGWLATVDGRAATVMRVNYAFRGTVVPAGEHTVEFRYRPWSVISGALLGLVTVLLGLGWMIVVHRRRLARIVGRRDR
jgi:hypothetical protein